MVAGREHVAAVKVPLGDESPLPGVPNLALRRERIPNLRGAELLGYGTDWRRALSALPEAGLILVLDADLDADEQAMLERAPGALVWLGTVLSGAWRRAEAVLPVTNMAEENGTYVNRDGRLQRYQQAKGPVAMARPAWWVAGEVLMGRGPDAAAPATGDEAFALLGEHWPVFAGLTYAELGFTGRVLSAVPTGVGA
jgi:NADH-quinone oxidoreductase subunit G